MRTYREMPFASRQFGILLCCLLLGFAMPSCRTPGPAADAKETSAAQDSAGVESGTAPAEIDPSILERLKTEKWHGDLAGLVARRYVRVLISYNKTGFFYDGPQPRGVTYEALKEFEKFLNTKLNTGNKPVYFVFIPVTHEDLFKRMSDGRGDLAASNVPIVPELESIVDFSTPVRENVKELLVTGPAAPPISSIDDLAGKEIFVRRMSRYWANLEKLNTKFRESGKPEMIFREADGNLQDEDILDMVHAGVVGITVMDDLIANFWAQIYDSLQVHQNIEIATGDRIGWAAQKNTPEFMKIVDEFVAGHKIGTTFGNMLLQRYLKDTKWAKNNIAPGEMERFKVAVELFKKYGAEYDFDWLMIAAQAYQESGIDQSRRSAAGAVGVMQIKPSTAEDKAIGIKDVDTDIEKNIQAGVKYMNHISEMYLKDGKFDKTNRGLFAFAAYNAGPARVAALRKQARAEGLDPNKWFNNVELVAAKEIGNETVTYVSNIYKYYVAYKLIADQKLAKKKRQ